MTERHTILVVDDEPDVVDSVRDLLRLEFRVLGAHDAKQGLEILAREPVAAVMTDQRMPGASGVAFLASVRAQYPDVVRLLVTGYADLRAVIDAINQGHVYRYVTKPWDPDELLAVLRDAVHLYDLVVERARLLQSLKETNEQLLAARDDLLRSVEVQRKLEEHVHRNQKMEALGLMAGGIAHDFGNVVSTVLLAARVLQSDTAPGSTQRALVEEIQSHAERGATLTRQLLSFSRQKPGSVTRVELNRVLEDLDRMVRRILGTETRVELALAPELPAIVADRAQIEQVVLNLVLNARDAVGERNGVVTITTRAVEVMEERPPEYPAIPPGRYVLLCVTDNGHGMDAVTRQRLFEPFFTTKEAGKGTGLGLATVFSIVRQHHGDIHVESAPGEGATFSVFFPAETVETAAAQ